MINQTHYGNIKFDNRESDVIMITQKQELGDFNIIFIQRENVVELIKELQKKVKLFDKRKLKTIKTNF